MLAHTSTDVEKGILAIWNTGRFTDAGIICKRCNIDDFLQELCKELLDKTSFKLNHEIAELEQELAWKRFCRTLIEYNLDIRDDLSGAPEETL